MAKKTAVVVALLTFAGVGFTACDDDAEEFENEVVIENNDTIYTYFIISDTYLELTNIDITYNINGELKTKTVDPNSAIGAIEERGIPCKIFSIKDVITERPLTVTVKTNPKENTEEIITQLGKEPEEIYLYRAGIISINDKKSQFENYIESAYNKPDANINLSENDYLSFKTIDIQSGIEDMRTFLEIKDSFMEITFAR